MSDEALEEALKDYDPKDASKKYEEIRTGRPQTAKAVLGVDPLKQLKHLTKRHAEIVALHVSGSTAPEIAQELNCSTATVYRVINDPKVEDITKLFYEGFSKDLEALKPRIIKALIGGLEGGTLKGRLEAIDKYIKLVQALNTDSVNAAATNLQININNVANAREDMVANIKRLAKIEDAKFEDVAD